MNRVLNSMGRYLGPPAVVGPKLRLVAGLIATVFLAVLVIARLLPPDERGFGTHERLGLPPCGMILTSGLPCPSCGMTTSFSLMMHGRPLSAFVAQPAGATLCLGAMIGFVLAVHAAATGRVIQVDWERIGAVRLMLGFALFVVGGWGLKMAIGFATGQLPAPH